MHTQNICKVGMRPARTKMAKRMPSRTASCRKGHARIGAGNRTGTRPNRCVGNVGSEQTSEKSYTRDETVNLASQMVQVQIGRVFWADHVKMEVIESLKGERAKSAALLAAKQEWIIRRNTLLKNVLIHAHSEGYLSDESLENCMSLLDVSDQALFSVISLQILFDIALSYSCIPQLEMEKVDVDITHSKVVLHSNPAKDFSREDLLFYVLSWALKNEDIVQPQEYQDLQFSWTFKDQPYVARKAAWRTVISADSTSAEFARSAIAPSIAHTCVVNSTLDSQYSGTSMTTAAFNMVVENGDDICIEVANDGLEEQSIECTERHIEALKPLLLAHVRSKSKEQWLPDQGSMLRIRQVDGSDGTVEINFVDIDDQILELKPDDLYALLDACDFCTQHPHTLPNLSTVSPVDMQEQNIYLAKKRARKLRSLLKVIASVLLAGSTMLVALKRNDPAFRQRITHLSSAGKIFQSRYIERYSNLIEKRGLRPRQSIEEPGNFNEDNQATICVLTDVVKAVFSNYNVPSKRNSIPSNRELKYQVVITRSGKVVGISPMNTEAVSRWKHLSESESLQAFKADEEIIPQDTFVFILSINPDGSKEVMQWKGESEIEL